MKTFEPSVNPLQHIKKEVPYSPQLVETADLMVDNTVKAVNEGQLGTIEAAGQISLAVLLKATAEGKMSLKQAFPFLKGIAEKKTPNPVTHIESHQTVDMRAMIGIAIEQNPNALEKVVKEALVAREQVKQRLGTTDNMLELTPRIASPTLEPEQHLLPDDNNEATYITAETQELETFTSANSYLPTSWQPGLAPEEITKLHERDSGGSRNI